jgi:hypothetical protein
MSCGNQTFGNMIPVTGGVTEQKDVVLVQGPGILIQDQSDANTYKFRFSTVEITPLSVDLTLVAKAVGVTKTSPILKGTVIDELNLSWVYNTSVVSQTLTNTGGLTPPVLGDTDVDYDYTGQTIDEDMSVTIEGNDGLAQPGSIASDTASISFGNYMWLGAGASKAGQATSGLEAFLESLSSVVKTSRVHTYYATGGVNEKHFVAYPKAYGLGTFTKGIFTGGYWRLKNVAGTLKVTLGMGDVETDIIITNSEGHAEAYYVYETEYDNQADAVTSFTIS